MGNLMEGMGTYSEKLYKHIIDDDMSHDDIRRILFLHNEANPNGKIDRNGFIKLYKEYKKANNCSTPVRNADKITEFIFKAYDLNKDGYINYDEFANSGDIFRNIPPKDRLECAFDLFDFDSDGQLTRDEVKAGIVAMLDIIGVLKSNSFIDELTVECMRELDFNQDGSITKKEFIRCLKKNQHLRSLLSPFK